MPMPPFHASTPVLMLLVALAACDRPVDSGTPNGNLAKTATGEPSPAGSLANQIVVDPARTGHRDTPGRKPSVRAGLSPADCEKRYRYDGGWVNRLPAALPLFPQAKLVEAAGTDAPGCRMRVVSFTSNAPAEGILAFYRTSAMRAGYSADRQIGNGETVLAGTRGDDAYYLVATPLSGGGTTVDLIANHGG